MTIIKRQVKKKKKRPNPPDETRHNRLKTRRDIADLEQRIAALERLHDGLDGAA